MAGELEGGEVYLVRAEFTGESSRRGDFTVDPPSAELCSSRAAAIGAQEDLQQPRAMAALVSCYRVVQVDVRAPFDKGRLVVRGHVT